MDAVLDILRPNDLWDFFIYAIFFMSLATLVFIPDKNMQPTTFMTIMLVLTIVDKLRRAPGQSIPVEGLEEGGFATLLIHVAMFALPMMSAGLIRVRGRKGRQSRPLAIFTGILGGMYALLHFFTFVGMGI